jgi:hypothetical protein
MTRINYRIVCRHCGYAAIAALPEYRPVRARCTECDVVQGIVEGWTREELTAWGTPWPPPAGWREHLKACDWTGLPWEEDARPIPIVMPRAATRS